MMALPSKDSHDDEEFSEAKPTRTLASPAPSHVRRTASERPPSQPPTSATPSSGPRSLRAPEERFQQVQASLSRLQELDTAPASLKSQRFDVASDAPVTSQREPVSGLESTKFDLGEAIEHAAARELPADVQRSSVRRLGQFALLNGALIACLAVAGAVASQRLSQYLPPLLAGLALNLGLFGVTRLSSVAPRVVMLLGYFQLVLYCLALSVFRHSHPWPADEVLRSFSPAVVAIVLFGALVPQRPARVLIWGLIAAATDPLVAHLSGSTAGSAASLLVLSLSPLLASGLAYFSSTITYDLTETIAKARGVGSYKLVEQLGTGGMGEVWRAEHRMLARGAAIKLIKPKALKVEDPGEALRVVRLFELEAQATTMLTSPHTISVYDFGVTPEGHFYYAMELLDGFDLQKLVEQHGPQSPERVAHILSQVAESLNEAHGHRYVHRDLKPANVFLCRYGGRVDFAKVLDFGLVLDTSDDEEGGDEPDERRAIGTPSIMAPEMLVAGARVDHRSDIYALGCLGYWLLTGTRVFPAKTRAEMLRMHAAVTPELPSVRSGRPLPQALEDIVMKCLQKNPAARPQSALEIADALDASGLTKGWSRDEALTFWESHASGPMSARLSA